MLLKKEIKNLYEYTAVCNDETTAVDFENFLKSSDTKYYFRQGQNVYFICSKMEGLQIAKPFIKELLNKSKLLESENSKESKVKVIEDTV